MSEIKVIIYHGKKGFINKFIRKVCKDTETHVAFLHEDLSVSDARPQGGFLHRIKHNYKRCEADIYKINLTREQRELLEMSIESKYGRPYDWGGLLGYWLYKICGLQFDSDRKSFCSEIGVDCVRETGAKFHNGYDSGKIAPCEFANDAERLTWESRVMIRDYKIAEVLK